MEEDPKAQEIQPCRNVSLSVEFLVLTFAHLVFICLIDSSETTRFVRWGVCLSCSACFPWHWQRQS